MLIINHGYLGKNCEIDTDECASNPCVNGGTCTDLIDGFKCSCQRGFYGPRCSSHLNECASNPCLHGGTCEDDLDRYIIILHMFAYCSSLIYLFADIFVVVCQDGLALVVRKTSMNVAQILANTEAIARIDSMDIIALANLDIAVAGFMSP